MGTANEKNLGVSGELYSQLQARAEVEGKSVDELAEEAVRRLLMRKDLHSFVAGNREDAGKKGFSDADVPRLIEEYRNEMRGR
jgi:hypothetical protein